MGNETCEQRIGEHLTSRMSDFDQLMARMASPSDEQREEAYEEQWELPLSVEVLRVVKVLLSWGGPSDWFECTVDEEGEITRISYHFQDWFDHASRWLDGREFENAREFLATFVESAMQS